MKYDEKNEKKKTPILYRYRDCSFLRVYFRFDLRFSEALQFSTWKSVLIIVSTP